MIIDFAELSANRVYHMMTQTLIPRPVAWVLSACEDSSLNLAPFSYFSAVSSDPPLIMLSIGKKAQGEPKDTRRNIIERRDFVVHIPHSEQACAVTESSRGLPYGESESAAQGLSTTPFGEFSLPRLRDCRIAYACECYRVEDITDKQAMILAEVKQLYIDDAVLTEDNRGRLKVHADRVDPLARLGGDEYAFIGELCRVPRPS